MPARKKIIPIASSSHNKSQEYSTQKAALSKKDGAIYTDNSCLIKKRLFYCNDEQDAKDPTTKTF